MANFAEDVWCGGVLRVAQEISAPFMSFVGPSPRFFATGTDPLVFSPFTGDPSALGRAGHTGSLVMRTDTPFGVWQKNGPLATDWVLVAGGGGGGDAGYQAGQFIAAGGETFVDITLPVARVDALYNAKAFGCGLAFQLTFDCPKLDYTLTTFRIIPSAALEPGDVVGWEIGNLT